MLKKFAIIPLKDSSQTLRLLRFFMAFASYFMWMGMVIYCFYQGIFRMTFWGMIGYFSLVVGINLIFYIMFRSGINKRFKDPSLTIFQMITATFFVMIVIYYMDEVRGVMLFLYLVVFVFGVFRLKVREFFVLAMIALISYGFVIVMLVMYEPQKINIQIEVINWIVLATVLLWFSLIGGYINQLRNKIEKANTELSSALDIIEKLAIQDELTSVFNRRQMYKILEREKALVDRSKNEQAFSVCIIDLDLFKRVNDTFGHLTGDMVLKTLATALKKELRDIDSIARYGGEEFVLILTNTDLHDAIICAHRMRKCAKNLKFIGLPESFRVSISVGVSEYQSSEPIDTLLARADTALYKAKSGGRNRVECEMPKVK